MEVPSERIVIVDSNDVVIGSKDRATLDAIDIYRASALWLSDLKTGDILLVQRKWTKAHDPGKWSAAVCGTNQEGETYEANIVRETAEEIGLHSLPLTGVLEKAQLFWGGLTGVLEKAQLFWGGLTGVLEKAQIFWGGLTGVLEKAQIFWGGLTGVLEKAQLFWGGLTLGPKQFVPSEPTGFSVSGF